MRHRTPLAVAVVGALLVGGATTGTTLAQWRDEAMVSAGSITSGAMSHTVLNGADARLGTVSLAPGATSASSVTATVRDTSAPRSKNLRQDIRVADVELTEPTNGLSASDLRLSATRKTGGQCPASVPVSAAAGYTSSVLDRSAPGDPAYDVCVVVAATSQAPASTGTLRLTFAGEQARPGGAPAGWTFRTTATVSVAVTNTPPAAPALRCGAPVPAASDPGYAVDWTGTGTAYRVYRSGDLSGPYTLVSTQTSTSYTDPSFAKNQTRYFKVVAVNAVGLSVDSNVLEVSRHGNSDNFRCGAP
jgi:hypothetical protein